MSLGTRNMSMPIRAATNTVTQGRMIHSEAMIIAFGPPTTASKHTGKAKAMMKGTVACKIPHILPW